MTYELDSGSSNRVEMGGMDNSFFLVGLLNAFMNRFQAVGDRLFGDISWKQGFVLICIRLFQTPPTLHELSSLMGSSHQNAKQLLLKLERAGYVAFVPDAQDRRKQRIVATDRAEQFSQEHAEVSATHMAQLFEGIDPKQLEITVQTILQLDGQLKKMKGNPS